MPQLFKHVRINGSRNIVADAIHVYVFPTQRTAEMSRARAWVATAIGACLGASAVILTHHHPLVGGCGIAVAVLLLAVVMNSEPKGMANGTGPKQDQSNPERPV